MMNGNTLKVDPVHVIQALGLLSRLPVPPDGDGQSGADAAWAYPVAGLIIGALAALIGIVAHAAGVPPPLSALLVLAAMILTCGAMHEDGLADTFDGLAGGWTRERRLEIMKDSHIGTYGVLALILALGSRWSALWLLFEAGPGVAAAAILTAAALSRAAMPALMAGLPPARDSGLSHSVGTVGAPTAALAAAVAVATALIFAGWGGVAAAIWAGVAALAVGFWARSAIGGQTGDILGAGQQAAEVAVLISLAT